MRQYGEGITSLMDSLPDYVADGPPEMERAAFAETAPAGAHRHLAEALAELDEGVLPLRHDQDDVERALTDVDRGGVWTELGALSATGPGFARADSPLGAAVRISLIDHVRPY